MSNSELQTVSEAQRADQNRKTQMALQLIKGLLEAIDEMASQGAPSGPMYMVWMTQGGTYQAYQEIMFSLTRTGLIRQVNNCYFITPKGQAFMARLKAA